MSAGLAERRAECRHLHRLRVGGWRALPSGEWVDPRTGSRLATLERAARVQAERDAAEREESEATVNRSQLRDAAERLRQAQAEPPPAPPRPLPVRTTARQRRAAEAAEARRLELERHAARLEALWAKRGAT